jgi:hypothetical protein
MENYTCLQDELAQLSSGRRTIEGSRKAHILKRPHFAVTQQLPQYKLAKLLEKMNFYLQYGRSWLQEKPCAAQSIFVHLRILTADELLKARSNTLCGEVRPL